VRLQQNAPAQEKQSSLVVLDIEIKDLEAAVQSMKKLSFVSSEETAEKQDMIVAMESLISSAKSFYTFVSMAPLAPAVNHEDGHDSVPPPSYAQAMASEEGAESEDDGPWPSPYNVAAREGNFEEIKRLVAAGEDILATGEIGQSPAYSAAVSGNTEILEYLIDHGADYTSGNEDGFTPLNAAVIPTRCLRSCTTEQTQTSHLWTGKPQSTPPRNWVT
jgi:ankyrin repeat protein